MGGAAHRALRGGLALNLVSAFIFATAWAYLACAVYTALGRPPLVGIDTRLQTAFYLCAFAVFLYVSYNPSVWILNLFLGVCYSFACVASFIGLQRWAAYWKDDPEAGSAAGQIEMAFWDLVLAVVFLSLV